MHVPATIATLVLCIVASVLVRLRWTRLLERTRRLLIQLAAGSVLLIALAKMTHILTTSDHVNAAVYLASLAGCIFLLVLFTLLKPYWLTSFVVAVLILPLFFASPLLPLAGLFSHVSHVVRPLGDGFVSDLAPLESVTQGGSGADFTIYRRFSWAPFLQRRFRDVRYFNTQCDTSAAYAILQPDHRHVLMVCPATQGFSAEGGLSIVLPLYSGK